MQSVLLPIYGWPHQNAGRKYPAIERSFRSTTWTTRYTERGFTIRVLEDEQKVVFSFSANHVDRKKHGYWLKSIEDSAGLGEIDPQPYWGFDDLMYKAGSKLKNTILALAESKKEGTRKTGTEYFWYNEAHLLTGFDFNRFLTLIREGVARIDFDARTGHDHGTKFRIQRHRFAELYRSKEQVV